MKLDLRLLIAFAIMVIITACALAAEELKDEATKREADIERIDRLREQFLALNSARDAAGVANLHTVDVVLMVPNSKSIVGRDALEAMLQVSYDMPGETSVSFSTEEVEVLGQWAFVRGTYAQTGPEDSGKYLQILKRQPDGSWKYARNMWSSDHPAPGSDQQD